MKNFYQKVYEIAAKIPKGKVATYGQIAMMLGQPKSARIVGWAMKVLRNDVSKLISTKQQLVEYSS